MRNFSHLQNHDPTFQFSPARKFANKRRSFGIKKGIPFQLIGEKLIASKFQFHREKFLLNAADVRLKRLRHDDKFSLLQVFHELSED